MKLCLGSLRAEQGVWVARLRSTVSCLTTQCRQVGHWAREAPSSLKSLPAAAHALPLEITWRLAIAWLLRFHIPHLAACRRANVPREPGHAVHGIRSELRRQSSWLFRGRLTVVLSQREKEKFARRMRLAICVCSLSPE